MEKMGTELDFDDLARLIGDEIPTVASSNAHAEEKGFSSISEIPYEGTSIRNFHGNVNMMDGNISMRELHQSSMDQMLTRHNTVPEDQSLTLAFGKLKFHDEAKGCASKSLQGHDILLEDHYSNNLNKQLLNVGDASVLASWGSSNHLINGVQNPHLTNLDHQNLLSRQIPEQYKKWQVGQLQPFETSSPAMPLTRELVNVPFPNLQFPITPQKQQILHNGRSPVRYVHPQQINHRQIGWPHTEEEQMYRMHGQFPHLQHLNNHQLERLLPNQHHEILASRISSQNRKQQYYEVPMAHHLEQSNHEPSWKTCALRRGSSQLNPVFSTPYMDTVQGMEKVSFPRKMIARNPGLDSVDAMRFMSIGADKSVNHFNQSRNGLNSCVRYNNFAPTTECICHGHLSSSALYSQSLNHKIVSEKFNSVDEIRGRIFLLAKDQHGCQFLQKKLTEGTDEDIENIFNEIIDRIVELMVDAFGNYLVQKLLAVCNDDQRMQIIHRITQENGEIVRISCDMHGTRVIQKVIETLKIQEQVFMIISSLKSGLVTLMKNINGNHVAQHCLDYLMPSCSELLFDAAINSCVDLATDRHGCCVLQKCLGIKSRHQNDLISAVAQNALVISQDQYGNYVVQFVLKLQIRWSTEAILKQLGGNFGDMSLQKYSSNVVEKCLQLTNEHEQLSNIVLELINDPRFDKIMQNPYGNYAIQTALKYAKGTLYTRLVEAVKEHTAVLRTSPYGKKVLSMIGKSI